MFRIHSWFQVFAVQTFHFISTHITTHACFQLSQELEKKLTYKNVDFLRFSFTSLHFLAYFLLGKTIIPFSLSVSLSPSLCPKQKTRVGGKIYLSKLMLSYINFPKSTRSFEFRELCEVNRGREGQIKAFEMHEPGNTSSNLFSFNLFPM